MAYYDLDLKHEKIRVMANKLEEFKTKQLKQIDFEYLHTNEYKKNNTPPGPDAGWKCFEKDSRIGGIDEHYWIHFRLDAIKANENHQLRLSLKTGREGQWDPTNPQGLIFLNGKTTQGIDINHTWIPLEYDTEYDVYIYFYSGMVGGLFDLNIELIETDTLIEQLYFDINVPLMCLDQLPRESYDYIRTRDCLDRAVQLLDLRDVYSQDFYDSISKTREYLKTEFYEGICGESEAVVSCIGHTHIDVAWLWTVDQTREKAQRSFATVNNMMEHYDDYVFMSSQPQLYQLAKESDPELFEKIKQRVKEGRWEVDGAMWLEADSNLTSGESLVRQLMYGKKFIKDEFGIDSDTLWLPDVFGYSGALPQILKRAGVNKFFTAKISWNDTNKLPHDVFMWQGIDGTEIFASLINGYVQMLEPKDIYNSWKDFKDKSITNNTLVTFGWGDGGGGPTYEMLENHKRLKYGIPGMPKTVIEKEGKYFERVQKDFEKNSDMLKNNAKWVGELYLEKHRATYTTVAKNKKNNRRSEFALLEAETLSILDKLINNAQYPKQELSDYQRNVLLNQFHDIIPGSSIKEVYDVTDVEYRNILNGTRNIIDDKLRKISDNIKTDGGIFVYNPTPCDISAVVEVDNKQIYAENVPAHGWKVVEENPVDMGITVNDYTIENDLIKVTFNDKYEIISVYDKECRREVIADNGIANRIEIFEDYPYDFDAWEICDYYTQKMWVADDVTEFEKLENGIKIKRLYGKSTITQIIKLNKNSKRIDFKTTVDWHEDHVLMKAAFPVDIHSNTATYEIQFGNVERPTHKNTSWDNAKFEVCAHKWADLSEGNYGVSLLNDCKYGHNVDGNVMKRTLLKAATYPYAEADKGMHEFTYSLYPHSGDYKSGNTIDEAFALNVGLEAIKVDKNDGVLPQEYSLINTDMENVIIETIKEAEESEDIIVRLFESYNQKASGKIVTGFDFKKVYACDLLENVERELSHNGREIELNIRNFEIVTLKFEL